MTCDTLGNNLALFAGGLTGGFIGWFAGNAIRRQLRRFDNWLADLMGVKR